MRNYCCSNYIFEEYIESITKNINPAKVGFFLNVFFCAALAFFILSGISPESM